MRDDLVVVVPGVMGSGLADRDGREVWGLSAGTALGALRTLGGSLRALELPDDVGDGPAPDGVVATGLMPSFHVIPGVWTPVQGYSELLQFLGAKRFGLTVDRSRIGGSPPGNLVVFAYDWRLSNRFSAESLKCHVESALLRWRASAPQRRDAKVVFICHSMGGLVARWYLDRLGGAEIARVLVTLGTPHRGAAKTVDQLINGVRKGAGPFKLNLTRFARSLPSSYQLLPEYACIKAGPGELKKTTQVELPIVDKELVADGMRFHEELDAEGAMSYPLIPVVGIGQPTPTSVELDDDQVVIHTTIDGVDKGGDGTVPRLAARPNEMLETNPAIRGVGEGHGLLAAHRSVTDQLDFVLTAEEVVYRAVPEREHDVIGVSVPDLHEEGEAITVSVSFPCERTLEVLAVDEYGREAGWAQVRYRGETEDGGRPLGSATLDRIGPGGYTILVRAPDDPRGIDVAPVRSTTLVLG
jgi:pimeloyl-ACP methyl ester carboxylesterase